MRSTFVLIIVGILLVGFTLIQPIKICKASGNTIYVDDDNTAGPWEGTIEHPYQHIQDGITAADPGDTIYVYSGEYHENIVIDKNTILTGQNKDNTIIDGGKNGHVVYAHGSDGNEIETQISGFTIKNAGGTGNDCIALSYVNSGEINDNKLIDSDQSDGIQLDHCTGVTISGNIITGNKENGINLILSTDNTIGNNNQIQNNQVGIRLYLSSNNNIIYDNPISGNTQYGVYILQSSNNRLYLNDFSNNGQNAQDTFTNSWSYNGQGNYWDDYNGVDVNPKDGIGDTPYNIPPGGSNQDLYPLGYFGEEPPTNQKPVAYIDPINPSTATYGHSVSFSGYGTDSDGTIEGYNWRSNIDGQLNTSASFSTTDLSVGQHVIYFKVVDNDGEWSDEKSASITITQNQKPIAYILGPVGTVVYGNPIEFSGYGTDPDGQVEAYSWRSVPSGISSNQDVFTLSNLPVDEYTIYFKVKDDYGDWSLEASTTLTIIPDTSNPNEPPVANADGPYSGYVNEGITFDGSNSRDPDTGDSITYHWTFGDNATGEDISPTHTYSSEGNYTVELTVIDNHGLQSKKSTTYANVTANNGGGSDNSNDKGTPGFELIILIISIGIIFLYKRYKNRRF